MTHALRLRHRAMCPRKWRRPRISCKLWQRPPNPAEVVSSSARIKMKGIEVADCDSVLVDGYMEATFQTRLVQISESGVVTGVATMDVAEIWGRFDGELTAHEQLIIHPSGRVNGKVQCAKIKIEEGGRNNGGGRNAGAPPTGCLVLRKEARRRAVRENN